MSENQSDKKNFRHLVRVANTDLDGSKKLLYALTKIKGVSVMLSNAVLSVSGIPKDTLTGTLTEADAEKLNEILFNLSEKNIPSWMFNRRKDYETGNDLHILSADLQFTNDNDKKRLKKTKSFRGMRHAWGLPLRGQKTRSNFRRNKGKVQGVKKKK